MEHIGDRLIWYYIPFTDIRIPLGGVNVLTVFNTIVVMVFLLTICRLAVRKAQIVPGRGQYMLELFVGGFEQLVASSLELSTQKNRQFLALIASLFIFLVLSNFMGFLPTHYFEEPTGDINCTLGLGFMGMTVATWCAVRTKGFIGYLEELCGPIFSQEGATGGAYVAGKLSALFFFPLSIIGESAKIVSISFRLFGNITGGAIIIIVISHLIWRFSILSIGLDVFFVFFVGPVQAFVFTMLTLTYIAVAIK
ncbi:MAG: F0F1 ATP synthase subunit A [Candidatus Hydrogenedentes bacterium]|nr:F0F1 ATP synthase subunit A [Candidatus Hydrogenedentota bacterium]